MRVACLLVVVAIGARAEELPLADGVTVELGASCRGFALGEPIPIDVRYRNTGTKTWRISEPLVLRFYDDFIVTDEHGARVPNPFDDVDPGIYDGPVRMHDLPPGGSVVLRKYLNACVAFDRPGTYVVRPRAEVEADRDGAIHSFRCKTGALELEIHAAPDREARDAAVGDLKALWADSSLREETAYARYRPFVSEANGTTDALKLLVFRREPALLPFWLDRLAAGAAFAPEGLAGLPDRAEVLKALEARLASAADRRRLLWAYACLASPKTDDVTWAEVYARRSETAARLRGATR